MSHKEAPVRPTVKNEVLGIYQAFLNKVINTSYAVLDILCPYMGRKGIDHLLIDASSATIVDKETFETKSSEHCTGGHEGVTEHRVGPPVDADECRSRRRFNLWGRDEQSLDGQRLFCGNLHYRVLQ